MGIRRLQRSIAKSNYEYLKKKESLSILEQKANLFRNGITEKDLKEEFTRGYGAGWEDGRSNLYKTLIACICLVMDEKGVDRDEIINFLREVDGRVALSVDEKDESDEVIDRMGIELQFHRAIDRIEEV